MQTYNNLLEKNLEGLIEAQIVHLKEQLAFNAFTEIWQFKYIMGAIEGLKTALQLLDDAKAKTDQATR